MSSVTTSTPAEGDALFDGWFDPIESGLRTGFQGFIQTLLKEERTTALSRGRVKLGRSVRQPTPPCVATSGAPRPPTRRSPRRISLVSTRAVCIARAAVFTDGVGKDIVSRIWRKVKTVGTPGTGETSRPSRSCG